jgi:hypothetical protein
MKDTFFLSQNPEKILMSVSTLGIPPQIIAGTYIYIYIHTHLNLP